MAKIDTKLVNVEGLPYSGKSTTAHFISDLLTDCGENVSCFDENHMCHPADYTFHAFMKDEQVRGLAPEEQRQLYDEGTKRLSGLIIPLTKISVSLFGTVIPYKIYDNLDWETEKPVMLERWQSFSKKALLKSKMHVFNSCILQNPISEMMMRFDFTFPEMWSYIFSIYRMTAALNPVVVYLKCTDIKARLEEEICRRKPTRMNSMIDYHTSQGYGKRNGLKGFNGYVDCLEARQRIELKILSELPVEKLILTDPFKNWTDAHNKISGYLKKKSLAGVL